MSSPTQSSLRALLVPLLLAGSVSQAADFSGYIGGQGRWFYDTPANPEQADSALSINIEPEWYLSWNNGNDALTIKPYVRIDSEDSERSHADIRELYWLHVSDNWELGVGISKVFWGVSESQHLVDIVNQTDLVEAPDGEEKLGQPMVRWSTTADWGVVDLFLLPGFRPRTYPGEDGRLRAALEIDQDHPEYESGAGDKHVDVAARWFNTIGDWDLGGSVFKGTSREPLFNLIDLGDRQLLRPYYPQITQYGLDAQLIAGEWLWKFESIFRHANQQDFAAFTGGFEYTLYGVFDRVWDLGLLMEYSYDSRDEESTTGQQNDGFAGARLAFNDAASSEILIGITQDLDNSQSASGKIEASTRLGDATKVYFEAWYFNSDDPADPIYALRQDSFIELSVEYHY